MQVMNCSCYRCQGVLRKQKYVKYWRSLGREMEAFDVPNGSDGVSRFEKEAYEDARWARTHPHSSAGIVAKVFQQEPEIQISDAATQTIPEEDKKETASVETQTLLC